MRSMIIDCMQRLQRLRLAKMINRWQAVTQAKTLVRERAVRELMRHAWRSWSMFMQLRTDQHKRTVRYVAAMRLKYQHVAFHAWFAHTDSQVRKYFDEI